MQVQRSALVLWCSLVLAGAAGAGCQKCRSDEVQRDGKCVQACNSEDECTRLERCVDGQCVTVDPSSSSSSAAAPSSSASSAADTSGSSATVSTSSSATAASSSASLDSSGTTSASAPGSSSSSAALASSSSAALVSSSSAAPASSGLDGGSVPPEVAAFLEFCASRAELECSLGPCERPELALDGGTAACRRMEDHRCQVQARDLDTLLTRGRATYSADRAGRCLLGLQLQGQLARDYGCPPEGRPPEYWLAFHDHVECQGGVEQSRVAGPASMVSDCGRVITGLLADDDACASDLECASGSCKGTLPGTCGHCVSTALPGPYQSCMSTPPVPPEIVGPMQACQFGYRCDQAGTLTCLPVRGAGESCGVGIGQCSLLCGFMCTPQGDGGSTCAPASPAAPCDNGNNRCPRGFACDPGRTMGYCLSHAREGESCTPIVNRDVEMLANADSSRGTRGGGRACALGLVCDTSQGDGACRVAAPRLHGDSCVADAPVHDVCSSADFCENGQCAYRPGAGSPCTTAPCQPGLACSAGTCVQPAPLGQPCFDAAACLDPYAVCLDGLCADGASVPAQDIPRCL